MTNVAIRRLIGFHALLAAILLTLCSCKPLVPIEEKPITVYATVYPIYALVEAVTRDAPNLNLHCLVQPQDGCLRDYVLSDWDKRLLDNADAVIAGGRGLESFESALTNDTGSGPAVSSVLYNLSLYNASGAHVSDGESHLEGPNPHLYMSIEGAQQIVESIDAAMQVMDPDYGEIYAENALAAQQQLDALARDVQALAKQTEGQPVILMNEALVYVARDYGLEIAGQVDRESGEALYDDALDKCLEALKATNARVILIERQAPQAFVQALEGAGFIVTKLDILSTHREEAGFETYLSAQRDNAAAIRAAFEKQSQEDKT